MSTEVGRQGSLCTGEEDLHLHAPISRPHSGEVGRNLLTTGQVTQGACNLLQNRRITLGPCVHTGTQCQGDECNQAGYKGKIMN